MPTRLVGGSHIALGGARDPLIATSGRALARPQLPLATLRRVLADDARRADLGFELHPSSALFAARGTPAGFEALAARLADLERAAAALAIEVGWAHTGGDPPAAEDFETIALLSGETGVLGSRRTRGFLASYKVEVANDSGVADPLMGVIATGRTLHVTAARLEGGARLHVEGFLDCAELVELADFDPGTPDLGSIQIPTVAKLQVAFAGFVEPGGQLRVDVAGSGLEGVDGTFWIRARTAPDSAMSPSAWRVRDVAWLERRVENLPEPAAGVGIDEELSPDAPRALWTPLSAFELLQSASQFLGRSGRPTLEAAPGIVFGPLDDRATWAEIDAFATAAEQSRAGATRLDVTAGSLAVSLPVSAGAPARVLSGRERTWLVDYDVALAPETWMPIPRVRAAFDGVSVEAELHGDSLRAHGFVAATLDSQTLEPAATALARLELPERAWRTGRAPVGPGSAAQLVAPSAAGASVELRREPLPPAAAPSEAGRNRDAGGR